MARKYNSQEIKFLINKHSKNLKLLEASYSLPSKIENKLQNCINKLFVSNVFSIDAMNSLKGKESDKKASFGELVKLLYLYKRVAQQFNVCQGIIQNNKYRIISEIKAASPGSNSITWLLASSKKKQNIEDAYEKLLKETEDSDYWRSSQEAILYISENDNVTIEDGWDDFNLNIGEYRGILTKKLPQNLAASKLIDELDSLVSEFEKITSALENEKGKTELIKENIKNAAERMVMVKVLDILKTVPVEEINREKRGFRVKALREAGYTTVADLYAASAYQLTTIYGVSQDAAHSIKSISRDFAIKARRNAKIKLSIDNQTKEASKLVIELSKYKQYSNALAMLNKLDLVYGRNIKTAIADIRAVGNGIYWNFLDKPKRDSIKKSFIYLSKKIRDSYHKSSSEILGTFKLLNSPVAIDPWDDFKKNSITYYNILEEVIPGVLGNDDKLYGLPEDLAREIQDECFFPEGLNCELRRYQEWGVKYILHQERVLLGDEMGLGKTVQAIATMVSLKNTNANHFIVVCPASVLPNWCKEIAIKSKLRVTKIHGSGGTYALKSWIKTGGVAVTTYETTGIFKLNESFMFDLLVVDEAHFIKNINATRSKNVRHLARFTKRILFMTGTALENNVDEMISLIDVLQPTVASSIKNIAFMSTAPQFREKIAGVYYRRKREDVLTELPDLIENREWCAMSRTETQLYEEAVLSKNFMGIRRLSWNVENLNESCKARRMMEIITEAEGEGRKVLIFSFFLDTINKIYEYLGDRCCNPINGSLQPQRRQEIIDEFNADPQKTVLCAQIQSGGTGLNIQAASVVIICEPQFKPSIENQAISRAYRMGQARNVFVYRLLCENTIDERITDLLEEKQAIFDAFADKSVAAENTEKRNKVIDEITFGKIIEEEIERIKAKVEASCSSDDASIIKTHQAENKKTEKRDNVNAPESKLQSASKKHLNISQQEINYINTRQKKTEDPKYDVPMITNGMKVISGALGEGTITNIDKNVKYFRVTFAAGEKPFVFPDAFVRGWLKFKNT